MVTLDLTQARSKDDGDSKIHLDTPYHEESELDRDRFRMGQIYGNIANNQAQLQTDVSNYQKHRTVFLCLLTLAMIIDIICLSFSFSEINKRVALLDTSFYGRMSYKNTFIFYLVVKLCNQSITIVMVGFDVIYYAVGIVSFTRLNVKTLDFFNLLCLTGLICETIQAYVHEYR